MNPQTNPETVRRILDPRTPRAEVAQLLQSLSEAEKTGLILRIAETAHRKTLIIDIANRVSDSLSLDVLFPRLMEVVTETLNADRSSLFLHDADTGEREAHAAPLVAAPLATAGAKPFGNPAAGTWP